MIATGGAVEAEAVGAVAIEAVEGEGERAVGEAALQRPDAEDQGRVLAAVELLLGPALAVGE